MTTSTSTRLPALGYAGVTVSVGEAEIEPAWKKEGWHWLLGCGPAQVSSRHAFTILVRDDPEGLFFIVTTGFYVHHQTTRLFVWPDAAEAQLRAQVQATAGTTFTIPSTATQLKLRTKPLPDTAAAIRLARAYAKDQPAVRQTRAMQQEHENAQKQDRQIHQVRDDVDVTAIWKTPSPWTLNQDERDGQPIRVRWLYTTATGDKFRIRAATEMPNTWQLVVIIAWRSGGVYESPVPADLPSQFTGAAAQLIPRVQQRLLGAQQEFETQARQYHAVLAQLPSAPMAWWRAGVPAAMAFPGTKGDEEQVRWLPVGALLLLLDTRGTPICLPSISEAAEGQRKARRALFYSGLVDGLPDGYGEATVHLSFAGRAAVARYKAEAARGDATQMEGPAGSYEGFPLTHTQERARRGFSSLWRAGDFGPFSAKARMQEEMDRWLEGWRNYSTADVVKEMVDEAADRVQIADRRTGKVETMPRDAHRKRVVAGEYDRVEMRWKPDNTPRVVT